MIVIFTDVRLLVDPPASAAGNLQKQTALQHICMQPEM